MAHRLPFLVLFSSLGLTFSSPTNPFTREGVKFEHAQQEETCFIHVKIQSCQEAGSIQLRMEDADTVLLHGLELDVSKAGDEPDLCLPVPCKDGLLTRFVKVVATSEVGRSMNIVVSPEKLEAYLQQFQQEDTQCLGNSKKPADVTVTCKEKKLEPLDIEEAMRFSLESVGRESASSMNYMSSDGYNNEYDQTLDFSCGSYQVLSSIESRHNNTKQDRQYKLGCHRVASDIPLICYWTPQLNQYDKPFVYSCPQDYVMAGIHSEHSDSKEDRTWRFRCCYAYYYVTESCTTTEYINELDQNFNFSSGDRVFTGAHSYHDNCHEDRRWSIMHCKYVKRHGLFQ